MAAASRAKRVSRMPTCRGRCAYPPSGADGCSRATTRTLSWTLSCSLQSRPSEELLRKPALSAIVCFVFFAMALPCYYAAISCGQSGHVTMWMRGRRLPKERHVCGTCSAWLSSECLADEIESVFPPVVPNNVVADVLALVSVFWLHAVVVIVGAVAAVYMYGPVA